MTTVTAIQPAAPARSVSTQAMVFDPETVANMARMAEMMAGARIAVPKHLVGSPGDCLAIVMQSAQWGMNPFAVAQKTHLVNGALGYEAQLVNAVVSSSSLLSSRISYEWEGDWKGVNGKTDKSDDRAVFVSATLRGESQPRILRVSMAQVGDVRNSPLWASDPRQQIAYLATKRWARLNAPDVLLGVYTVDELQDSVRDMGDAQVVDRSTAAHASRTEAVKARLRRDVPPQEATQVSAESTQSPASDGLLEAVLEAIRGAATQEELDEAGDLARDLDDDGKAKARAAYKARREDLAGA
jgi:hypothetical protein